MEEKYLPVGTVVKLKEGIKAIMITGFCAISSEEKKLYDYCACLYPEGVVGPEMNLLFNHDQIAEILHKGLVSQEEFEFKQKLNAIISQKIANGEFNVNSNISSNVANVNENLAMSSTVVNPTMTRPQMFNTHIQ